MATEPELNADSERVTYAVSAHTDPRCQGFNTEPGVIYHAHDLPRCPEMAVGVVDDHILCQRHIDAWLAAHIDCSGAEK